MYIFFWMKILWPWESHSHFKTNTIINKLFYSNIIIIIIIVALTSSRNLKRKAHQQNTNCRYETRNKNCIDRRRMSRLKSRLCLRQNKKEIKPHNNNVDNNNNWNKIERFQSCRRLDEDASQGTHCLVPLSRRTTKNLPKDIHPLCIQEQEEVWKDRFRQNLYSSAVSPLSAGKDFGMNSGADGLRGLVMTS